MAQFLVKVFSFLKDEVIAEQFPYLTRISYFGVRGTKLALAMAIVFLAFLVYLLFHRWTYVSNLRRGMITRLNQWTIGFFEAIQKPFDLFLWTAVAGLVLLSLAPDAGYARAYSKAVVNVVTAVAFFCLFWTVLRFLNTVADGVNRFRRSPIQTADRILLTLILDAARALLAVGGFYAALKVVGIPSAWMTLFKKAGSITIILALAWFGVRATLAFKSWVLLRFKLQGKNNLRAREVQTQMQVAQRVIFVFIFMVSTASILMLFDDVRKFGATLLASAGLAGVVVGFAAQQTLGNILAGLQIAITQPIRIDDVVILEGEWGKVEEISLTHVVLASWDQRRLIVPINYFITKPFQNWTKESSDLLGTVTFQVDYLFPIDHFRSEAEAVVRSSRWWDGRVAVVHVTDVRERTLELRVLVSALDSGDLWELRCHVREALMKFIQTHYPDRLPQMRHHALDSASGRIAPGLAREESHGQIAPKKKRDRH